MKVTILDFLQLVREGSGYFATLRAGEFRQTWVASNEEAIELTRQHRDNYNCYISMASFSDGAPRTSDRATDLCCFWVDMDIHDPNSAVTIADLQAALADFTGDTSLPSPNIIHETGHGLQAYWVVDNKLTKDEWLDTATKLEKICLGLGLPIDSITKDPTRVLRIPNTLNFRNPDSPVPSRVTHFNSTQLSWKSFKRHVDNAFLVVDSSSKEAITKSPLPTKYPAHETNISIVTKMLDYIDPDPNETGNRESWMQTVWAIADLNWGDVGIDLARNWSQRGDLYNEMDFNGVWNAFDPERSTRITVGSLFHTARLKGYTGTLPLEEPDQSIFAKKSSSSIQTIKASSIEPKPIDWLVEQSIPMGELVVIAGQPGLGKSQIALNLASAITDSSVKLPDGSTTKTQGSIVILANEDDAHRTIAPRLDAAGADRDKIEIVQGVARDDKHLSMFQLESDISQLESLTHQIGDVKMIIIDPPTAYLGSKTDSYKESDVRRVLTPLAGLAQKLNVVILLVNHLNKRTEGNAQQRIGGSTAWTAVPRAAFLAVQDQHSGQRMLLPAKNNLGSDTLGFKYEIAESLVRYTNVDIKAPYVRWLGTTTTGIESMLNPPKQPGEKSDKAREFLTQRLSKGSQIKVEVLKDDAEIEGISWSTIERVRKD
ncbi:AAA family ATPase, partial [Litoricolaceae bacterium]|nr:AAA family ATPase [Litorivicinaceae bacterium]